MKNVLSSKITFLLVTTFISACLIGCAEKTTIWDMEIEDIEIIIGKTDKVLSDYRGSDSSPLFSVNVLVDGFVGPNTCYTHYKTNYLIRNDYGRPALYRDGETINISILAAGGSSASDTCGDAVITHQEAIFIGLCVPGNYVLNINGIITRFQVGSDS